MCFNTLCRKHVNNYCLLPLLLTSNCFLISWYEHQHDTSYSSGESKRIKIKYNYYLVVPTEVISCSLMTTETLFPNIFHAYFAAGNRILIA